MQNASRRVNFKYIPNLAKRLARECQVDTRASKALNNGLIILKQTLSLMKKSLLAIVAVLFSFGARRANAQVSDVNFIVSPSLGYTMWNSNLNLGNTATYGARVGFGFGPILELRGNYERSFNLKSSLDNVGWTAAHNLAAHVEKANVSYERWGGDVKVNLWNNARFTPYVLGGMGVLKFNYDDAAATGTRIREEKLYGTLGAGLKVNLARRVALSFEVRDMLFNVSPSSQYATLTEQKTLSNWNALASLDIYLGGTQYSKDEVSKAYRRTFNGGFRGLRFAVEPSAAYLNFRDNALYRDTWMLGLSAGVDFTSLIGVRGFYYRNTKDADKFSFNTNSDLSIYGANLVTRLNSGRGLTPYFTLGAGYINAGKSYVDRNGNTGTTDNGWFALGGVGLDLYLHRNVSLFGTAEAMLLNNDNPKISAISDPAKVNVNWMYRAGVRFNLGLTGRSGVEAYRQYSDSRVAAERALAEEKLRKQRSVYDQRIAELDTQLKEAAERLDTAQLRLIAAERGRVEAERTRSNTAEATVDVQKTEAQSASVATSGASRVLMMKPAQLDELIRRVIAAADAREAGAAGTNAARSAINTPALSDIDKILLISVLRNGQVSPAAVQQAVPGYGTVQTTTTGVTEAQVQSLLKRIDELQKQLDSVQKSKTTVPAVTVAPVATRSTSSGTAAKTENGTTKSGSKKS